MEVLQHLDGLLGPAVPAHHSPDRCWLIALPRGTSPLDARLVRARAYLAARGIQHARQGDNLLIWLAS